MKNIILAILLLLISLVSFCQQKEVDTETLLIREQILGYRNSLLDSLIIPGDSARQWEYKNMSDPVDSLDGVNFRTLNEYEVDLTNYTKGANNVILEPSGFRYPNEVICSYDTATNIITLTGNPEAYYQGDSITELVTGWASDAHTETDGVWFLYYDGSAFTWSQSAWTFDKVQISYVYHSSLDKWSIRETHGMMDWQTHKEFHETLGTYMSGGGDIEDYTLNSTTAVDRRPDVSSTTLNDEDLQTINDPLTRKTYCQAYLSGTETPNLIQESADMFPLSGNQPYWNEWDGSAWVQTLVTNNNYFAVWLIAAPMATDTISQQYRYMWGQSQSEPTDLSEVEALTPNDIDFGAFDAISPEWAVIGKVVCRYVGGDWIIISVSKIEGTQQSQSSSSAGTGGLSSVYSNFTLTGDGTSSNPLGVDTTEITTPYDLSTYWNTTNLTVADTTRYGLAYSDRLKWDGSSTGLVAATGRTSLNVDVAGTDNSTDVTLSGTPDYITIFGQTITRNQIDLTTDVSGILPIANIATGTPTGSLFVRDDGTLATPAGGGNVSTSGTPVINDFARFVNATDIEGRSYSEVKTDLSLNLVENAAASGLYEPIFSKNTGFNKDFGTTSGTVVQGNDSRILANSVFTATPSTVITAGTNLSWSGNTLNATGTGSSPLTSKGDLYTYSTTDVRLGVGSYKQSLRSDWHESEGIIWSMTNPTMAEIKNTSSTGYTHLIHGSAWVDGYLYGGERIDNGQPTEIARFVKYDENTLEEVDAYIVGANLDVESITYDYTNDVFYITIYNASNYLEIREIEPSTMTIVGSTHIFTGISAGNSPAITNDGTYIYGVSGADPAVFFKIDIATFGTPVTNTWTNGERGHSARMSTDETYFYSSDLPYSSSTNPYFAKVAVSDLSYSEVSIGAYVKKTTDDFAIVNDGSVDWCYLGGEYDDGDYNGVKVNASTLAITGFPLEPTYGLKEFDEVVYSASIWGYIEMLKYSDEQNVVTFDMFGQFLNEIVTSDDGRVFGSYFDGGYDETDNEWVEVLLVGNGYSMQAASGSGSNVTGLTVSGSNTKTITLTQGAGGNVVSNSYTDLIDDADSNSANEGSLSVSAGTSSTSVVNSNTSGSASVTIEAGTNMAISETGNTITLSSSEVGDMPIRSVIASTTATATDYTIFASGSGITITLPTASSYSGKVYVLRNIGASTVTISSYVVFGPTSSTELLAYQGLTVQSNGTAWYQIQ